MDFTKAMINSLQTGADNLTLADPNEESANMLALQTRQQLGVVALSLAGQAQQSVLQLF
jgi:flagellin-like hook-associated protein FlgL